MKLRVLLSIGLLLGSYSLQAEQQEGEQEAQEVLARIVKCRAESSPLMRLDCYDRALLPAAVSTMAESAQMGVNWQRAMTQEQTRTAHSTAFLVTQTEGDNPTVMITTPAIGHPPPRPVLVLSCRDNITRLQIALVAPRKEGDNPIQLTTDKTRFTVHWFLREGGYLLESSRGLAGIEELKRLAGAESLAVGFQNGTAGQLNFNIAQLDEAIKPLRTACHW